jgi:hypothetical protein
LVIVISVDSLFLQLRADAMTHGFGGRALQVHSSNQSAYFAHYFTSVPDVVTIPDANRSNDVRREVFFMGLAMLQQNL